MLRAAYELVGICFFVLSLTWCIATETPGSSANSMQVSDEGITLPFPAPPEIPLEDQ